MRKKASRTSRKARQTAHDAQACESTRTSPFLLLPRELRDRIYDYAFGSEITIFTPPDLILEARPKGRKSEKSGPDKDIAIHYPKTRPAYTRDLPLWLLTNKQICSEALSYFGSVRTFTRADLWKQSAFLEFVDRLNTKELELRLECERATRYYPHLQFLWGNSLYAWIIRDLDTEKWDGRFRKVIISIPTDCDGAESVVDAARFDQLEALARRLVGNVRTVTWGPFIFDYMDRGNKVYKRNIVVDRKD